MKSLKLIDRPRSIPLESYESLKQKLLTALLKKDAIKSVYQLGSVKNPGISDLDILCIFENDSELKENPLPVLSGIEQDILTHSLFGVREKDLAQALDLTYFTNFKLLGGHDFQITNRHNEHKSDELNTQVALEFMCILYISLSKQIELGIVKWRAFLLEVKALDFDLKLLK